MYIGGRSPGKSLLEGKTVNNQLSPLETWGIQYVGEKMFKWPAKGYHVKRKQLGQLSSSTQVMTCNVDKFNRNTWANSQNLTVPWYLHVLLS